MKGFQGKPLGPCIIYYHDNVMPLLLLLTTIDPLSCRCLRGISYQPLMDVSIDIFEEVLALRLNRPIIHVKEVELDDVPTPD